jgi:hypothetical protein
MGNIPKWAQQSGNTVNVPKWASLEAQANEKIFSGGTFSDVMDVLQIPQYAATGLLSGKGIVKGVQTRLTPSKVFKIKNPFLSFITNVVTDPLMYLGVGGLTKVGSKALAEGTAKSTFGAAVKAGERSLLNLELPFAKSGIPLIKGERTAEGITKLGEKIKTFKLGEESVGAKLNKMFGTIPETGGKTLTEIEGKKSALVRLADKFKNTVLEGNVKGAQALEKVKPLLNEATKLGFKQDDLMRMTQYIHNPTSIKLSAKAAQFADRKLAPVISDLVEQFAKETGYALEGKKVMNMLIPKYAKEMKQLQDFISPVSKVGKEQGTEKFATNFKLIDKSGNEVIAHGTKSKAVDVLGENSYVNYRDGYLPADKAAELTRLKQQIADMKRLELDVPIKLKNAEKALEQRYAQFKLKRTAASPKELNDYLEKIGKPRMFEENIMNILVGQGEQIGKISSRQKFINALKDKKLFPELTEVSKDGKIPDRYMRLNIKNLKEYALPKDMAEIVNQTFSKFSNIKSVDDFVHGYDVMLNTWKKLATYVNPAFHGRNLVSNMWQLNLARAFHPLKAANDLLQMRKIQKILSKGGDVGSILKGDELTWWNQFRESGLGGTGRFFGDIERGLKKQNWVFETGGGLGNWIEDSSKWTLYKDRIAKGFTHDSAVKEVKKYLFDYGDLTDFEKNVMKRIFPFYTWSRKNVPLQVAMLIQNPGKFSVIAKAKASIENAQEGKPMDDKLLPEWMRQGYNIWLGENPEGMQNYLKLEGFLPAVDLGMVGRPLDEMAEQISPLLKTPYEMLTNYNTYFKRPISEFPGQTKKLYGVNVPAQADYLARQIRPVSEYEKLLGLSSSKTQQALSPAKRLQNYLFGQVTRQFDEKQEKKYADYDKSKIESQIKSDLKKARKEGDTGRTEDLMQLLKDLNKE